MRRLVLLAIVGSIFLVIGTGAALAATVLGSSGPDVLSGTGQSDTILGRGGDDRITGGEGEDVVRAGRGDDFVSVAYEDDRITPDTVYCGPGQDTVKLTVLKIKQPDVYKDCEKSVY